MVGRTKIDSFREPKTYDDESDTSSSSDEFTPPSEGSPPKTEDTFGVLADVSNVPKRTKKSSKGKNRRRRSSAHFTNLSGRFDAPDEDNEDASNDVELSEMCKHALRMNAENRINAGNSWSLKLIENIDKFLVVDEGENNNEVDDVTPAPVGFTAYNKNDDRNQDDQKNISKEESAFTNSSMKKEVSGGRVNFTKASCTIDASVKIYSYRVDDVHLTSYKVLANLNRTNSGNKSNDESCTDNPSSVGQRKQSERRGVGNTIESNLENLNVAHMDSALDIDPLFHKMSITFDEGGAKGLLLANLGVAADGCRIIFDSKEETTTSPIDTPKNDSVTPLQSVEEVDEELDDDGECKSMPTGSVEDKPETSIPFEEQKTVDVSPLINKFEDLLKGSSFDSIQFLPQIKTIKTEFDKLDAEGFVSHDPIPQSERYKASEEEEREAEEVIHREALERSRATEFNTSQVALDEDDLDDGGMEASGFDDDHDFGTDNLNHQYDDNDFSDGNMFEASAMVNETMEVQPSFYNDLNVTYNEGVGFTSVAGMASHNEKKATVQYLLDVICNTNTMDSGGRYDYFDTSTLQKLIKGNAWAGSAHWKKSEQIYNRSNKIIDTNTDEESTTKKGSSKKSKLERSHANFMSPLSKCALEKLLKPPTSKRGCGDPFQLTKRTIEKQSKTDNLLPYDAEVTMDQLFRLFLRPNSIINRVAQPLPSANEKKVGFMDMAPVEETSSKNDDDDFDSGGGFNMFPDCRTDEEDNFDIENDIRKVEKVEVGYAKVAKKIDVKKLKHDLWTELEKEDDLREIHDAEQDTMKKDEEKDEESSMHDEKEDHHKSHERQTKGGVFFSDIVTRLDDTQSQEEVTVPFYFICLLHLANEKCLALDSSGFDLNDFKIRRDHDKTKYSSESPGEV